MKIDTHLGSGQKYGPLYHIDPKLLVGVPRSTNRKKNNITAGFLGTDVWYCYEFSTVRHDGLPIVGVMKICYEADSPNIVESKSLKLYLNSWNFEKMPFGDEEQTKYYIENRIIEDLRPILKTTELSCNAFLEDNEHVEEPIYGHPWENLESNLDEGDKVGDNEVLELVVGSFYERAVWSRLLRSNCLVTGQPDFGDLFIRYISDQFISYKSLLNLILSFREKNHLHEEVVEIIYQKIWDALHPVDLFVAAQYTRRGGISISPVRATSIQLIRNLAEPLVDTGCLTTKSMRH